MDSKNLALKSKLTHNSVKIQSKLGQKVANLDKMRFLTLRSRLEIRCNTFNQETPNHK